MPLPYLSVWTLSVWSRRILQFCGLLVPVGLAAWLVWQIQPSGPVGMPGEVAMRTLHPLSAEDLENIFAGHDYGWPPPSAVPPLAVETLPQDFDGLHVNRKKALFLRTLLPIVLAENARLRERREFLQAQFAAGPVDPERAAGRRVVQVAQRYKVRGDINDPAVQATLLRRVDEVPVGLVLAQAANESGWGTSRFAQQANNLFGVWTWNPALGMMPESRPENADHFIRVYPDVRSSVRGYMYNINVGRAYLELRHLRAAMRAAGVPLDAMHLAGGLSGYSARGSAYVKEIRTMIAANDLEKLDNLKLAPEL